MDLTSSNIKSSHDFDKLFSDINERLNFTLDDLEALSDEQKNNLVKNIEKVEINLHLFKNLLSL